MATVLVVDDRPGNREYLVALLGFAGHRTLQAADGAQALACARAQRPDLVITDILMPGMDGHAFVQRLRADPLVAGTRVIFYSAVYTEEETAQIASSCGVTTVLSKPAEPQAIFDAIDAELGLGDAASELSVAAPPARRDPAQPPHPLEQRLAALEALCLRMARERRPETLAETFVDALATLLDADELALCLLDADGTQVRHLHAHGIAAELLLDVAADPGRLPGALAQADTPLREPGGAAVPPPGRAHPGPFLGLPVHDARRRHGWVYATRRAGAAPFCEEDEIIAVMVAAHLAVAYDNLNLYQLVQGQVLQLQREADARERADAALRESEHRLVLARQVFDSTAESIMMTNADANIVAANPAFERITGYSEAEVLGHNPRLLRSGRHDHAFYREMWQALSEQGQWRGEIWNRRKNGEIYPELISISAVRGASGSVNAYVSVSTDLSALKAAHHQVDYLANHDTLTGLANRALLFERMEPALASARRDGGQLALMMFNLDRLQRINDSLGQAGGDAALREVGRRTAALAGEDNIAARLGSDDFVLMLARCAGTEDAITCARKLLDTIARPIRVDSHDVVLTASIGIGMYPRDGDTAGDLLKAADAALTNMKASGSNDFRFFQRDMNAQALQLLALESRLRRALERGELALHYQPVVCSERGHIVGMEALLRWHSPELGLVPPCDFIPLAEETGLIVPVGNWVIREACRQNKAWQDAGLAPVRVAVNVSAHQVRSGKLPSVVRAALAETGLAPSWLEVELTETVMMGDSGAAEAQLAELRAIGVTVALDDFGTGYSSLGYLSRFSLDKLKIDQSFVRDITGCARSAAIAQATVALARGLSLAVVAEGVETGAQRDYLRAIGCHALQGYLYSRPVPPEQMAQLLRQAKLPHNGAG
ncbi:EAL domain-containing protein [Massilia solisilvae]|uniref:EAL domain-containing protein n=1 Tax=Massilia solisilvae TaxID=1811225 RepID=A0ABT2BK01_9BURK|nr:EAL domain-containing protein [Massilia solisilvae]MCS0608837.1 EAL domain-containing protein [Massilia solisilvae]